MKQKIVIIDDKLYIPLNRSEKLEGKKGYYDGKKIKSRYKRIK